MRRRDLCGVESKVVFLVVGTLEFVDRFEEQGWKLAGTIVPIAYIAWSVWLIVSGLVLLLA